MSTCTETTQSGQRCNRPATNGTCGANHRPAPQRARQRSGGRIRRMVRRALGRQVGGAAGASTIGVARAGFNATLHPDPLNADKQARKQVRKGAATGRRTIGRSGR